MGVTTGWVYQVFLLECFLVFQYVSVSVSVFVSVSGSVKAPLDAHGDSVVVRQDSMQRL